MAASDGDEVGVKPVRGSRRGQKAERPPDAQNRLAQERRV